MTRSTLDSQARAAELDNVDVGAVLRDVEVSEPLPAIPPLRADGRTSRRAWLLVRIFSEPLGQVIIDIPDTGLEPDAVATAIMAEFGPHLRARVADAGGSLGAVLPTDGITVSGMPPYLARRAQVLRGSAPPFVVVLCTRDRPGPLSRCLDRLLELEYPDFRILVINNAPTDGSTESVVRAAARRGPVEQIVEPQPGIAHARNRGGRATEGEWVAWIDDDELADRYWLAEIARAFADRPGTDVVSGPILPAELETVAQVWFEGFGGLTKGRGLAPAYFSPATAHLQNPLYPLPPFGSGGNMAFRPGMLTEIGAFDAALPGSEDTWASMRVLRDGGSLSFHPGAFVRHFHRREVADLRRQLTGYGCGLTAAYTSMILDDPRVLMTLLGLLPTALRDLTSRAGTRLQGVPADFPAELLRGNRAAMARGPLIYLRSRARLRRAARNGSR